MKQFLIFLIILIGQQAFSAEGKPHRRRLTIEEEALANQARAEIAKAIENNLVRIFAIATAQNEEESLGLHPRQEDGDFDVDDIVTPNPNVLPQVAQILGAIFSGSLNITRIVDGTVGLVPNIVRTQLQGIVKLLTGENINLNGASSTVSPPTPPKLADVTTANIIFEDENGPKFPQRPSTVVPLVQSTQESAEKVSTLEPISQIVDVTSTGATTGKTRYRVKAKPKTTTTSGPAKPLVVIDDEIDKIERDLRAAATILEPYEHKEPRFYAGMFTNVIQNVNMTEVTKAVPSIFKGATQAFLMLENLGILDTLPGSEGVGGLGDLVEAISEEEEE